VLLVCQWNEWDGQPDHTGSFEDTYNVSLSNDMEPTALAECGGYQHAADAGQLPMCDTGWGFFNLNLLAAALHVFREAIAAAGPATQSHASKPPTGYAAARPAGAPGSAADNHTPGLSSVDMARGTGGVAARMFGGGGGDRSGSYGNTIVRLLAPTKPRTWVPTAPAVVLNEQVLRVAWACIGRGCSGGFRVDVDDGRNVSVLVPCDNSTDAPPTSEVELDLSHLADGIHSVTVTAVTGVTTFPLLRGQRDADIGTVALIAADADAKAKATHARHRDFTHGNGATLSKGVGDGGQLACDSVTFKLQKPPPADRQVVSSRVGFVNQPNQTTYEYGPTIIQEDGVYYSFYCSPGGYAPGNNSGVVAWDVIRMSSSADGLDWSAPVVALEPSTRFDHSSVCDPSIIKFKGSYFLYHTCINTCVGSNDAPPDSYHQNRICVAISDHVRGSVSHKNAMHLFVCSLTEAG
jgi:hypothetical protein